MLETLNRLPDQAVVIDKRARSAPAWREGQRSGAHGRTPAKPEELKALAARIRAALED